MSIDEISGFDAFGLSAPLLRDIARAGFTEPTPIQTKALPLGLQGRDVLGCAQTGTGKTAAFIIPMIERLAEDHHNARLLADGLAGSDGIHGLDPTRVRTDFVIFRVSAAADRTEIQTRAAFVAELESRGVLMLHYSDGQIRAVTHYGIGQGDIERTVDVVRASLAAISAAPAAV